MTGSKGPGINHQDDTLSLYHLKTERTMNNMRNKDNVKNEHC